MVITFYRSCTKFVQDRLNTLASFKPVALSYIGQHSVGAYSQRAETLNTAFQVNPKRFKGIAPKPPKLPDAAWINPPKKENVAGNTDHSSTLN